MSSWFRDFAGVLVRPRVTMRRILETRTGTAGTPVVLLAICAMLLKDLRVSQLGRLQASMGPYAGVTVASILLLTALFLWGLFHLFAWVSLLIGRTPLFEGTGTFREVRLALAWGLAPLAVALLWRIPITLFAGTDSSQLHFQQGKGLVFNPGMLSHGCGVAALFVILEVGLLTWYLAVASNTLAEALHFTGWRGLGTLAAVFAAPLVIGLAALLASS